MKLEERTFGTRTLYTLNDLNTFILDNEVEKT